MSGNGPAVIEVLSICVIVVNCHHQNILFYRKILSMLQGYLSRIYATVFFKQLLNNMHKLGTMIIFICILTC